MNLIILGAPGAGKGTQAVKLAQFYNIDHISTGNLLREQIRKKTDIGCKIEELLSQGKFAPDDVVIKLLKDYLNEKNPKGFLLDGFPRNIYQAEVLETFDYNIDRVIEVNVADEIIIERMSGRVICPKCGAIFNTNSNPPAIENVCDNCKNDLIQRDDDKASSVIERLRIYHEITEPIIEFYLNKNLLTVVSGLGSVSEITNNIVKSLGEKS